MSDCSGQHYNIREYHLVMCDGPEPERFGAVRSGFTSRSGLETAYFSLGLSSAFKSPIAYWIPASICVRNGFEK